jgi:hypothetical protein
LKGGGSQGLSRPLRGPGYVPEGIFMYQEWTKSVEHVLLRNCESLRLPRNSPPLAETEGSLQPLKLCKPSSLCVAGMWVIFILDAHGLTLVRAINCPHRIFIYLISALQQKTGKGTTKHIFQQFHWSWPLHYKTLGIQNTSLNYILMECEKPIWRKYEIQKESLITLNKMACWCSGCFVGLNKLQVWSQNDVNAFCP